jgi:hypothetical protein
MGSPNQKIIILLIVTVIINYYTPIPYIGISFPRNHYINRIYLALFSGFIIVLTDTIVHKEDLHDLQSKSFNFWLITLMGCIILTYYFISNQLFISQRDYLLTMKENHDMDVQITSTILKKNIFNKESEDYGKKVLANRNEELQSINKILGTNIQ